MYSNPGEYTISLATYIGSKAIGTDTVSLKVLSATEMLYYVDDYIQNLDNDDFDKKPDVRKAVLHDMFVSVKSMLDDGAYNGAINSLGHHNIQGKADGSCGGNPKNDWIVSSDVQELVCMMIDDLNSYLESLL